MKTIKVLSLADGIASGLYALDHFPNIRVEYHAVEIGEIQRKIANDNHQDIIRPFNDIIEMAGEPILPYYDILLAGPTCTSLSSQGPRTDWSGESKIFFDCLTILNKCKDTNPDLYFMFENVHSMKNTIRDEISNHLGVNHFLGHSALVSGQDRKRYYWFNWSAPEIKDQNIMANDCLDEDGLHLFSFSKSNRNNPGEPAIVEGRFKSNGKAGTLVTGKGFRGQSTMNKVITKKMEIRDLTISEGAKLMGLYDYQFNCTEAEANRVIGNGWSIGMVKEILAVCPLINEKSL